jgi:hypothetical protein
LGILLYLGKSKESDVAIDFLKIMNVEWISLIKVRVFIANIVGEDLKELPSPITNYSSFIFWPKI